MSEQAFHRAEVKRTRRADSGSTIADRLEFYSIPEPNSGCLLWIGGMRGAYGRLDDRGAHVVAWEVDNGRSVPPGQEICHSCDVPSCVNPRHLWIGTALDNAQDKVKKGRHPRGENHRSAVLSDSQSRAIIDDARTLAEIAFEYGVAISTVHALKSGRTWAHIKYRPVRVRHQTRGENHANARLTEAQVREIRNSIDGPRTLAERFGVVERTIHQIRARETWRHL